MDDAGVRFVVLPVPTGRWTVARVYPGNATATGEIECPTRAAAERWVRELTPAPAARPRPPAATPGPVIARRHFEPEQCSLFDQDPGDAAD